MPEPGADPPAAFTGNDLRMAREAKGIDLKDIFQATRITVVNLEAIEEGRFHLLPEPVYARTFIKSYARYLGIDDRPILESYDKYLVSSKKPLLSGEAHDNRPASEKTADSSRHTLIWAVSALVIVLFLLYLFISRDTDAPRLANLQPPPAARQPIVPPPPAKDTPVPQNPAQVPAATTPATTAPAAEGEPLKTTPSSIPEKAADRPPAGQEPPMASAEKPLRLVITGIERTWLRIREDQKKSQDMMVERGDVIERSASASFSLDVGNAGGIEISFQGKPLGPIGKRGEVVRIKLP